MTFIGQIVPPDQCDENGVPLDWKRCRTCEERGWDYDRDYTNADAAVQSRAHVTCPPCGGHGSLEAAALRLCIARGDEVAIHHGDDPPSRWGVRCEDCNHPMSEGTWEVPKWGKSATGSDHVALKLIADGNEPTEHYSWVHFSRCDEKCDHGGPRRCGAGSRRESGRRTLGGTTTYPTLARSVRRPGARWRYAPASPPLPATRTRCSTRGHSTCGWRTLRCSACGAGRRATCDPPDATDARRPPSHPHHQRRRNAMTRFMRRLLRLRRDAVVTYSVGLDNVRLVSYQVEPVNPPINTLYAWHVRAQIRRGSRVLNTWNMSGTTPTARQAELRVIHALCTRQELYDETLS